MADSAIIREYLKALVASRGIGDRLCAANSSLSFVLSDTGEVFALNLFEDERRGLSYSKGASQSEISLTLTSDIAAGVFAGDRNIWLEIALGSVAVRGPIDRVSQLWPAIYFSGPRHFEHASRSDAHSFGGVN